MTGAKVEVGTRLGPYVVEDVLGRGAQGIVYLARDDSGQRVAVKVLRPDADEGARSRFAREARTTCALVHDGIVRVLAHGEDAGGTLWYAMERIDAPSLERRLVSGPPIDPRAAAHLIATIARAVHYAHEKGVLHRDLKPANVLLAGGSIYRPKIVDFGLALVAGQTRLTQSNAVVGTPCYLAPEVITGKKPTRASDVYALGAMLYELLVGRPPFIARSIQAILECTLRESPTPPRRFRPVPAPLERTCMQCLEKSPSHRPETALDVALALERWLGAPHPERSRAREALRSAWIAAAKATPFVLGAFLGAEVGFIAGLLLGWYA